MAPPCLVVAALKMRLRNLEFGKPSQSVPAEVARICHEILRTAKTTAAEESARYSRPYRASNRKTR